MPVFVGIDVGTLFVKVAVVKQAYRRIQLAHFAEAPREAFGTPEEAVRHAVGLALGPKLSADSVAVGLSGEHLSLHAVEIPVSAQKQLAEVLPFELEAQVPFDLEGCVFDYHALSSRTPKPTTLSILSATAQKSSVTRAIELVRAALGQEPERVGAGALSLAHALLLAPQADEATVGLLDIGVRTSDLVITRRGEAVFARTLPFGTLGLPASAPKLGREVRNTFAAYRAKGEEPPMRVYLSGGGALVSGAAGFLSAELGVPVEPLDLGAMDTSLLEPARVGELPRFAKAIGLALSFTTRAGAFDLRRGPLAFERGFSWIKEKVPTLSGLLVVVVFSLLFSSWAKVRVTGQEREVLEKALAVVTRDTLGEETTSPTRAQELIEKTTGLGDEDPMPHADAFDVLARLPDVIPTSVKHDIEDIDVNKGHVVMHGIVTSIPDVQTIVKNLGLQPCFADVVNKGTSQQPGTDRQKYTIEFDLRCPEDVKTSKKPAAAASAAPSASGAKP